MLLVIGVLRQWHRPTANRSSDQSRRIREAKRGEMPQPQREFPATEQRASNLQCRLAGSEIRLEGTADTRLQTLVFCVAFVIGLQFVRTRPLTRSWPNHVQLGRKGEKVFLTATEANKEAAPARTCIGGGLLGNIGKVCSFREQKIPRGNRGQLLMVVPLCLFGVVGVPPRGVPYALKLRYDWPGTKAGVKPATKNRACPVAKPGTKSASKRRGKAMAGATLARTSAAMADLVQAFKGSGIVDHSEGARERSWSSSLTPTGRHTLPDRRVWRQLLVMPHHRPARCYQSRVRNGYKTINYSPPNQARRFDPRMLSLPDFRTMPLVGRVSSGISRFPRPCIPALIYIHLVLPLSATNYDGVRGGYGVPEGGGRGGEAETKSRASSEGPGYKLRPVKNPRVKSGAAALNCRFTCRILGRLGASQHEKRAVEGAMGRVYVENLIEVRYRRHNCMPVQCLARRGDDRIDSHVSVTLSAPSASSPHTGSRTVSPPFNPLRHQKPRLLEGRCQVDPSAAPSAHAVQYAFLAGNEKNTVVQGLRERSWGGGEQSYTHPLGDDLASSALSETLNSLRPPRHRVYTLVGCSRQIRRYDRNTARLARRSYEALKVRVSVARIAPSPLGLGQARSCGSTVNPDGRIAIRSAETKKLSTVRQQEFGRQPVKGKYQTGEKKRAHYQSSPTAVGSNSYCLHSAKHLGIGKARNETGESAKCAVKTVLPGIPVFRNEAVPGKRQLKLDENVFVHRREGNFKDVRGIGGGGEEKSASELSIVSRPFLRRTARAYTSRETALAIGHLVPTTPHIEKRTQIRYPGNFLQRPKLPPVAAGPRQRLEYARRQLDAMFASPYSDCVNVTSLDTESRAHPWGRCGVVVRPVASRLGERVRFPGRDRSRIFACGNRAGRWHWAAGFLRDLPFPPPLHFVAAPYSPRFTLIGSQDLDVNLLWTCPRPQLVAWLKEFCTSEAYKRGNAKRRPRHAHELSHSFYRPFTVKWNSAYTMWRVAYPGGAHLNIEVADGNVWTPRGVWKGHAATVALFTAPWRPELLHSTQHTNTHARPWHSAPWSICLPSGTPRRRDNPPPPPGDSEESMGSRRRCPGVHGMLGGVVTGLRAGATFAKTAHYNYPSIPGYSLFTVTSLCMCLTSLLSRNESAKLYYPCPYECAKCTLLNTVTDAVELNSPGHSLRFPSWLLRLYPRAKFLRGNESLRRQRARHN
ncbi:hypothetical protein PR048_025922 [Dryococelus australis]|uniref:Uncharacterized protein n=1 Tax=Dryococelus australis TaxID=614101 RepID=A0ABQ9GJY5_9NEOP|nr:hypothetical protein PR048_025922 [Dryococelus australis]